MRVGLEIHQQLATAHKLFCACRPVEVEEHEHTFLRMLRPTQSELGEYDPAALFEFKKGTMIKYIASNNNSCLVEADEEPPHDLNREALETALIISLAFNAKIVDEVHVMRKIVIDGSNTTGFQRTMLIGVGGEIDGVKVESISLEEDAARIIDKSDKMKSYALDRLGVPLIEISLEPVTMKPEEIEALALKVGRLLRASKRVARGLGTIRQDVNISIMDGSVVEVKGVQRLEQLKSVIEYEMKRQHGLLIIAKKIRDSIKFRVADVSHIFKDSSSKVIKRALEDGIVKAIKVENFAGILGFEPYEGIRLGRELGELVRFYGLGGIFHSDELPAYGISEKDLANVREVLEANENDVIIIIAGKVENVDDAIDAIIERLREASKGVPAETRAATDDGRTVYSRPRPGSARMYPETDIPPIVITDQLLESLRDKVPKSWDEYIDELSKKYKINKVLAEKVFDSQYLDLFEELSNYENVPSSFIASTLTETLVSLERDGYNTSRLSKEMLVDIFRRVDRGEIAKESVGKILELLMSKCSTVDESIRLLGIESINEEEAERIIDSIVDEYANIIKEKGDHAFSILMGKVMSKLRGKVDGKKVSMLIREKMRRYK